MAIQMLLIEMGWQVYPVNEHAITLGWVGAVPTIVFDGVGTVFLVALWMPLFPTLWRRDHLITPNQKP